MFTHSITVKDMLYLPISTGSIWIEILIVLLQLVDVLHRALTKDNDINPIRRFEVSIYDIVHFWGVLHKFRLIVYSRLVTAVQLTNVRNLLEIETPFSCQTKKLNALGFLSLFRWYFLPSVRHYRILQWPYLQFWPLPLVLLLITDEFPNLVDVLPIYILI